MVERFRTNTRPQAYKPGNEPIRKGRPKGVPNKMHSLVKDAISGAAENLGMLEPIWETDKHGRKVAGAKIIGWRPTGEGGTQGYLVWLGANHPQAFAHLLGKLLPLQIHAMASVEATVTTKFSDAAISSMSLAEKMAAFSEAIGMTKMLPSPKTEMQSSPVIEGEAIRGESAE